MPGSPMAKPMARIISFDYIARRGDGSRVRGTVHAPSPEAAVTLVRERALIPISVEQRREGQGMPRLASMRSTVSGAEFVGFVHAFCTMVRGGVPLLRVLDVLQEENAGRALQTAVARMHAALVRGEPLSRAVERAGIFNPVHVAMIRAGEAGGILDEALERVARIASRDHAVRRRILSALTYPAVIALAAATSIALLVSTLTPALARLFAEMSVPLPPTTHCLLAIGAALRSPTTLGIGIAVAAFAAGAALALRGARVAALSAERVTFRLPLLGTLRRAVVVARVARTLGSLLRSGLPALDAIELSAQSAGSPTAAIALRDLRHSLREGDGLSQRLVTGGFFPPLFVQMVRIGEECGTLDALLDSVAEFYDVEAEAALHALTTLIEPTLIALLGGVVAAIALSVFLPLYSLIGSFR